MSHDDDFDHEHDALSAAEQAAAAQLIWEQDTLELRTVGIDIGSSTSHLLFAQVTLRRQADALTSRFTVVDRRTLWRSPIQLTPFRDDGLIDVDELKHFIAHAYHDAGLRRRDIDSGAVILTGEAIKRSNARAIGDLFAAESGRFVCATAGHRLESLLAAHGSGATALSRRRGQCALHVDVGGGTTKLALIDRGEIVGVAAFAVGGRLLARDAAGEWTRIDDSARLAAADLGLAATPNVFADEGARRAVAERLATIVIDRILGEPPDALGRALDLTDPLPRSVEPDILTFSGGVSEYLFGHESADHGDIARALADGMARQLRARVRWPVVEPMERIRATVIGASQFTVQVSGKTIDLPERSPLPVHNVPVVRVDVELDDAIDVGALAAAFVDRASRLDVTPAARVALTFDWKGEPTHARLLAVSQAIARFAAPEGRREEALFVVIHGDVALSIGRILREELRISGPVVTIDGIVLRELDYVDVGEWIDPPGVVPVVIKSLLFAARD